ncbi:hypothetical protein U3516DRAFT_756121 [Neocallimastix sp. 'constans']
MDQVYVGQLGYNYNLEEVLLNTSYVLSVILSLTSMSNNLSVWSKKDILYGKAF